MQARNKPIKLKHGELVQGTDFELPELRDLEQYFFTKTVIDLFLQAFVGFENIVCLTTPTLGDAYWKQTKSLNC